MVRTLLLIILVVMLLGLLPAWPYSAGWGYYPSGGLGLVLLIVIVLMLIQREGGVQYVPVSITKTPEGKDKQPG